MRPRLRRASSPFRLGHRRASIRATPAAATTPTPAAAPQAGTPAYLQQAYDLSYLSQTYGADMTVGVVVAYDDPTAEQDLAKYRSTFNLPACRTSDGCFTKFVMSGSPGGSGPPPSDPSWGLETSLDLDAVSAICPLCRIVLVEASSNRSGALASAQSKAESVGADVISDSFGAAMQSPSDDPFFGNPASFTFENDNVTTVAAAGDAGYPANNSSTDSQDPCAGPVQSTPCNEYPAALPRMVAAGATTLAASSGSRGFGESAWSGTGSGCDTSAAKPTWQIGLNTDCSGRAYSDISAAGDPKTGLLVYDSGYTLGSPPPGHTAGDGWVIMGGTSLAAPLISGYYGMLKSVAAAHSTPTTPIDSPRWPYDNTATLNDPQGGSNLDPGANCVLSVICNAMARYDGPTGAGSISGAVVTGAPGIGGSGPTGNYWRSSTSTTAQLQGGVYPNGSPTTYWWEYGTTTSYGDHTAHSSAGAGTAPVSVSGTLIGLSPGTTYHYRLVAQNGVGAGPMYGYDFTFTTAAAPKTTGTGTTTSPTGGSSSPNPSSGSSSAPVSSPKPAGGGSTPSKTPVPRPVAPGVGKPQIRALGGSSATVSASINPSGNRTTYYLAYGTSAKLGRRSGTGSTSSTRSATWRLRGLKPGKVYYLQVVATNGGGTRRSSMIRVRTSPVIIGKVKRSGNRLAVALRCIGSSTCRGRLTAKVAGRTAATKTFKVRGNRRATVQLRLNRTAAARARHSKPVRGTLAAVSSYNGHAATVSAKFRLS